MKLVDDFAIYCKKSHIFFAFYVALLVEKTYSLASILILLDLSWNVLGNLGVFPHQYVWIEPVQIKAILMNKY